jgi:hypothetical protein
MADYREIRLRLNLRRQRDRWLASALDEAAEELGAPVASIVRRSLSAYLRERAAGRVTDPLRSLSGTEPIYQVRDAQKGGAANPDEARRAADEAAASAGDPWLHDEPADLVGRLTSIGTPPESPDGGG